MQLLRVAALTILFYSELRSYYLQTTVIITIHCIVTCSITLVSTTVNATNQLHYYRKQEYKTN